MGDKYFKAIDRNKWVRNPQWLQFPDDDGLDDKCYALYAVFEDESNDIEITYTRMTQIDWGDGTVDTGLFSASNQSISHTFDYTTLSSPILTYEDGKNYKMVVIEFTCDNATGRAYLDIGSDTFHRASNLLDIEFRFLGTSFGNNDPNSYSFRLGQTRRPYYLERVKAKYPINGLGTTRMFNRAVRLSKLDVPSDFFNYMTQGNLATFQECGVFSKVPLVIPNITNNASGGWQSLGRNSFRAVLGDLNFPNITDFNATFLHSHLIKCGNVTAPVCTVGQNMFGGTVGSNSLIGGIGVIDMPELENARWMFRGCAVPEVIFTDCAAITLTTGMFDDTGNIRKLIMPGLTIGVDVSNNNLTADAIDDFFTSLGAASGSQTIDVSGNPGAATCDTSIATGKGYTVIT